MGNSEQRVTEQHSRPSVAHDLLGLSPIVRFVAMYRAVCTRGLVLTVRAFIQAYFSVVEKGRAVCAEFVGGIVPVSAIDGHHHSHGPEFTLQVPGFCGHVRDCLVQDLSWLG